MAWRLPILPFQARSFPLQGWGLIDLPLRATLSPAHPLARRDVPSARARVFPDRALRKHSVTAISLMSGAGLANTQGDGEDA